MTDKQAVERLINDLEKGRDGRAEGDPVRAEFEAHIATVKGLARSSEGAEPATWPERQKDLAWLDRQKRDGHCGESTSEAIQRVRVNECVDRIKRRLYLSPQPQGGGDWRSTVQEACDLLAERIHGNPARSAGHNARLVLERLLSAAPEAPVEGEVDLEDERKRHNLLWSAMSRLSGYARPDCAYAAFVEVVNGDLLDLRRLAHEIPCPDLSTPSPVSVEEIARMIAPADWELRDGLNRLPNPDAADEGRRRRKMRTRDELVAPSLATARTILARLSPAQEGEGR